jgi:predicted enzyme related to lactoylglutathione lyase
MVVAVAAGVVIGMATGFAYVHPDKPLAFFINELGVSGRMRRRGIGRRLLGALLDRAAGLGCTEAWVATEIGNAPARSLYGTAGGIEDDEPAAVYVYPLAHRLAQTGAAAAPEGRRVAPRLPAGGARRTLGDSGVEEGRMKRVTGIGGIFFHAKDPVGLRAWYRDHLGIDVQDWGGAAFSWSDADGRPTGGTTIWSVGAADGTHFAPSTSSFMINYRVADLHALVRVLRAEGCNVLEKIEESEYGKFAWVMDPEGNKVELWEPPAGQ